MLTTTYSASGLSAPLFVTVSGLSPSELSMDEDQMEKYGGMFA